MGAQRLRLPVTCPNCGTEQLTEFPAARIAGALRDGRPLRLYSACHDQWWSASDVEAEQVRQYVGALSMTPMDEYASPLRDVG